MMENKTHMAKRIMDYLESNQESMKNFLKELVRFETPSKDKEAQENIFRFLEARFHEIGYYTIRVKGKDTGGYLYARPVHRNKEKECQLLLGHCDTVWAVDTISQLPIHESDGKLTGPGIFDMKAGITQIVFAIKALKDLSIETNVTPLVLINSDEEIGSFESTYAIKRLSEVVNRAFVLEPPLGLQGKLKTARKGIGRFTISVKGRAAHAGLDPTKGVNAIVELAHQVQQLYGMNDFEKGITINIGMIEGGNSPNVVAPESKAIIDVRVFNGEDGAYITEKIYALEPMLEDVELNVEGGIMRKPMERTPANIRLWEIAKINADVIGIELDQAIAGGGSDGNTTSLYTATLDGLGATGDGAHARHEFIYTDKLIERATLLLLLLLEDAI